MAFKDSKSGKWRAHARINGRRLSRTFLNKALAEKWEAKCKLGQHHELLGLSAESGKVSFAEFSAQWMSDYCRLRKAESQWDGDARTIERYFIPAFGKKKLCDLRRKDFLELQTRLIQRGLAPKTVNTICALAKKMMNSAVEWEVLQRNPFAGVRQLKVIVKEFNYWPPEERDMFLRHCKSLDPEFHPVVLLACHTGLRLGEISTLRRSHVDYQKRLLTVSGTFSHKLKKDMQRTKNGEVRHAPLNDEALRALKQFQLQAPDAFLFSLKITQYACKRLQRLCRKIGVKELRFHDLRHTYAMKIYSASIQLTMTVMH